MVTLAFRQKIKRPVFDRSQQSAKIAVQQPIEADAVALREADQFLMFEAANPRDFALGYLSLFREEANAGSECGFPGASFFQLFLVHRS
jgi:hypothetical protein